MQDTISQYKTNLEYISEELLLDFSKQDEDTIETFLTIVEAYYDDGYSLNNSIDFALDYLDIAPSTVGRNI